jgi:phosphohistidine phosphatase
MRAYLVRHGEALDQLEDPARPLSDKGEEDIERLAALLAQRFQILPGYIFHSPKQRAEQTADIVSKALSLTLVPEKTDGLAPMDDPAVWAEQLETMEKDTMLVGHLPHLSRLASLLLLWDTNREILNFTPGTVVCLEKTGGWRVKWMISPDTLKDP